MSIEYFSSGSQLFDNVLGQGWPVGRLLNIQGDSASGKTQLATAAATSFLKKWPGNPVWYCDSEHALSEELAIALKVPMDDISFLDNIYTVEDWYNTLEVICKDIPKGEHGLMILDSLDALSDAAEMERKIGDASYGAGKARKLSELFRRINANLSEKNITTLVISQLRDQIGGMISGLKVRSGGKAVEFYSSIVIRLATTKKIKRVIKGVEKYIGAEVKVKCNKNKVAMPFRECILYNIFGVGVDEVWTCLQWLASTGKFNGLERFQIDGETLTKKTILKFVYKAADLDEDERAKLESELGAITRTVWDEIEDAFNNKGQIDDDDQGLELEE